VAKSKTYLGLPLFLARLRALAIQTIVTVLLLDAPLRTRRAASILSTVFALPFAARASSVVHQHVGVARRSGSARISMSVVFLGFTELLLMKECDDRDQL
jgi:hypothetical protein